MGGPHKCPMCTATFTRPQHVGRHMRGHTGDRPYPCDQCTEKFSRSDLLARHKGKAHPSDENPPPLVKGKRMIKGNKTPAVSAVGGKLAAKERRESEERERKGRMCTECQARDLECDLGKPCARCSALSLSCLYHPPPAVDTNAESSTSTAHLEPMRPTKATGSRPRIPAIHTSQQQAAIAFEAHNNAPSPPPFSDHSPQNSFNLTTSTYPSPRSSSNSTGSRAPASGSGSSSSSSSSHPTSTSSYNSAVFPSCLQPAPRSKQSHDQQFQQGLNQYSHPSYHNDHQDPSPGLNGNADDASSFFLPLHLLQQPAHPPQPPTRAESPACYVPHLQGMFEPFTNNTSTDGTDGADPNSMNARLYAYDSPMGSGSAAGSKASVEVDVDLAGISGYGMGVGGDMEITTGLSELCGKDDGGQAFLRAQHHAPQTQQHRPLLSYSPHSLSHSSQQPSPSSASGRPSSSHSHMSSTQSQPQPSHFLPQQQQQQQQQQPHLPLGITAPTMLNGSTSVGERAGEGELWSMLLADGPGSSGLEGVFSPGFLGQLSAGDVGGQERAGDDGSHQQQPFQNYPACASSLPSNSPRSYSLIPPDCVAASSSNSVSSSLPLYTSQPSFASSQSFHVAQTASTSHAHQHDLQTQEFLSALSQQQQQQPHPPQSSSSSMSQGGSGGGLSFNLDASALSASARRFGKGATGARVISGGTGTRTKRESADSVISDGPFGRCGNEESGEARGSEEAWETQGEEKRSKMNCSAV